MIHIYLGSFCQAYLSLDHCFTLWGVFPGLEEILKFGIDFVPMTLLSQKLSSGNPNLLCLGLKNLCQESSPRIRFGLFMSSKNMRALWRSKVTSLASASTRYLYIVCLYGAICLQILFLKNHILLFCHEILKFFAYRVELIFHFLVKK